ncbi:hypothetical protein ACIOMQ_17315 [Streptomyces sp. NPDC087845]|uniref:hypothetical protein n=1 Tax=Streptomyces sp. NPDC087845 TaxID=3365806 RepID=UPI00382262A6
MPPHDLQELLTAVQGCITGSSEDRRFAMAPDYLGSPAIASLITDSFPLTDGYWVLRAPDDPRIEGSAVVLTGTMDLLLGLAPARLKVSFDLADAGLPSLLAELPPLDQPRPLVAWNLGNAFPVWSEQRSVLTQLVFDAPAFWYSSIERAATDGTPAVAVGLTFSAATLELEGVLGALGNLTGLRLNDLDGAITGPETAPLMQLRAAPVTPLPIQGLDLPLVFTAVSAQPSGAGKIQVPPPPFETYLQFVSEVQIGSAPPIPVSLRFTGVGTMLTFGADLRGISQYAMSELQDFVRGAPIGTMLDGVFEIGSYVGLRDLSVHIGLEPLSLAAIGLGVGTTKPITVVPDWVEIPDVNVDFMVDSPADTPAVTALLSGTFTFLRDIPVSITAAYPEMVFTGSVEPDEPIPLARIVEKFVPSVTSFPAIALDDLYVAADFAQQQYAFQLAVSSDWKIPIGIARFQLEQASLALGYDGAAPASGFSGEIAASAVLFAEDDTEIARFFADWKMPGADFVLQGTFPEIDLTRLGTVLTGGGVPNSEGVPQIVLRDSLVRLRMEAAAGRTRRLTGTTAYRFDLATTVDVQDIGQAALAFEVRRGTDGRTGFAAGLVVQPGWKPDRLWSGLRSVMDVIDVQDAGLILSSITDQQFTLPGFDRLPYVPPVIQPGVTFFSSVELKGDVFSLLRDLFDHDLELDLYARIDPSNIVDSEIKASLPGDAGRNAVSFTGLEVAMKPGAGEFSITAGARFVMFGELLTLRGVGAVKLGPPTSATFAISVADWEHPFGITGLTVRTFGLAVSLDAEGLGVGVLGTFVIGDDPATQFQFTVGGDVKDFEVPDAFVCALESVSHRPLKVTDLVKQFTSLDLSDVPLLDGLAFTKLAFYIVGNPAGWTGPGGYYPAGIGIDADLTLYDWQLALKLEVDKKRGILADGALSKPIEIEGLLKISDAEGTKGPRMRIDTSALTGIPVRSRIDEITFRHARPLPDGVTYAVMPVNPYAVLTAGGSDKAYFTASGALRVLGVDESFSGSVTADGFEVNFHTLLAKLFRAGFTASFSKSSGFEGHAKGSFDFSLNFPNGVKIDGWQVLPPVVVEGPNATLMIDLVLKTTQASVALDLNLNWGSLNFHPKFSLDATQVANMLADLWNQIVAWITDHPKTFFADLLADVAKYVKALADGLIWAGQSALEIAEVLYHVFGVDDVVKMAGYLADIARLGFADMLEALMAVLGVSYEVALAALRAVGDTCAVATNEFVIYGGDATRRPGGGR